MIRIILFLVIISILSCKPQKQVTRDTVENKATTAAQTSQQTTTTASEVTASRIIATDKSELVTEISVIEYSPESVPVKETKIRQTVKRNTGSISEDQRELKQTEKISETKTEETTAQNKQIHKSTTNTKSNMLFIKFILGVTIGFFIADFIQNFSKRIQFFKRILKIK